MTRGRESNVVYVATDSVDASHSELAGDDTTATDVLRKILANTGAELSAQQLIKAEQQAWSSIAQLAAEYETIAAAAQHDRWATLIRSCGLTPEQGEACIESDAPVPERPSGRLQRVARSSTNRLTSGVALYGPAYRISTSWSKSRALI